jgi:hypothetical protein
MRTALTHLGALAIFAALSIAVFGVPLIARGFSSFRIGDSIAGDPQIYMWGFAIAHGLAPLDSAAVWAPGRLLKNKFSQPAPSLLSPRWGED